MLNRVLMRSSLTVPVRDLTGFDKKRHRVPERAGAAAAAIIGEITLGELEGDINAVAKRSRELFGYTRKEISASVVSGAGSVITPGFEYSIEVSVDEDSPADVIWRRELRNIQAEMGENLDAVFGEMFDRLEMNFTDPQSVEDVIDRIEALKSPTIAVDYEDTDLSQCEIRIAGFDGKILVTRNRLTIQTRGGAKPSTLMKSFEMAQKLVTQETGAMGKRLGGEG